MATERHPEPSAGRPSGTHSRLPWLDAFRGLIMILMALDHASYFLGKSHLGEFWGVPLPQYDSGILFITRFVTHICAPGFFFVLGIGMVLFAESRFRIGWRNAKIVRHYLARGLILIVLQIFLEDPAWMIGSTNNLVHWTPPPGGSGDVWLHFGVLSSLGGSMMICALLLRLSSAALLPIGLGAALVTQIVIPLLEADTLYPPILRLLLVPGQTGILQVFYPLFPWIGLAAAGMAYGKSLLRDQSRIPRLSFISGLALVLVFFVLRITGAGFFHPPAGPQGSAFLGLTKYPPDIAFLALTTGINLCLLSFLQKADAGTGRSLLYPLRTFGKSALFFYIVHLYLFASAGLVITKPSNVVFVYSAWILGLLVMLPACRWYASFKKGRAPDSLWRFL